MCSTLLGHGDPVTSASRSSKSPSPHETTSVHEMAREPPGANSAAARSKPLGRLDPVPGAEGHDQVDRLIGGDVLEATLDEAGPVAQFLLGQLAHPGRGLDGRHAKAVGHQVGSADAGAGADLERAGARLELTELHDVVEDGVRIVGPIGLVGDR